MKEQQNNINTFHMKNLKQVIESLDSNKKPRTGAYISNKILDFAIETSRLYNIRSLFPTNTRRHIFCIITSKLNSDEIAVGFDNYPMCVEFNKFLSKTILRQIQRDDIKEKLKLRNYKHIRGWVPKKNLNLYTIKDIDLTCLQEPANGEFINTIKDKELHACFEKLRDKILQNHQYIEKIKNQEELEDTYIYNISHKTHYKK